MRIKGHSDHVTLYYKMDAFAGVALYRWAMCEEHEGCSIMVMVGDDAKHHVASVDLTLLPKSEFCMGCGQIGCNAYA